MIEFAEWRQRHYSDFTMAANAITSVDARVIQALRRDVAHQIARYLKRLGISQLECAQSLGVPQPTLSKIVNGRVSDLSLELLIRIAARANLPLTLQTGKVAEEAGAYVIARTQIDSGASSSPSSRASRNLLMQSERQLTPSQRLEAFLEHNQLMGEWFEVGREVKRARVRGASLSDR